MTTLRKKLFLAGLLASAAGGGALPAEAAGHVTLAGEELDLVTPCIGRVQVTVDPAMEDGVTFDASQAGAAHVTIHTGKMPSESKVVIASKTCAPKAVLSVTVAPTVALSIHDSHDTRFVIRGQLAAMEASLESGSIEGEAVSSADIKLSKTAIGHFGVLSRAAQVVAHDTAALTVDRADLDALSVELTDASRFAVGSGRIDALTLVADGAASAVIGGTLNTAAITANGNGLVVIPEAKGAVARNGAGAVHFGAAPVPQPSPAVAPPMVSAQGRSPPGAATMAGVSTSAVPQRAAAASAGAPSDVTPSAMPPVAPVPQATSTEQRAPAAVTPDAPPAEMAPTNAAPPRVTPPSAGPSTDAAAAPNVAPQEAPAEEPEDTHQQTPHQAPEKAPRQSSSVSPDHASAAPVVSSPANEGDAQENAREAQAEAPSSVTPQDDDPSHSGVKAAAQTATGATVSSVEAAPSPAPAVSGAAEAQKSPGDQGASQP